jgi:hypothetical protein
MLPFACHNIFPFGAWVDYGIAPAAWLISLNSSPAKKHNGREGVDPALRETVARQVFLSAGGLFKIADVG